MTSDLVLDRSSTIAPNGGPPPQIELSVLRGHALLPDAKRLIEAMMIDPAIRDLAAVDAQAAAVACGAAAESAAVRSLWPGVGGEIPETSRPLIEAYRRMVSAKHALRDRIIAECGLTDPRHARWRLRQIARCRHEIGPARAGAIIFSPAAFELADGCSVGCWFCGVGAERLASWWRYTEENAALWRASLAGLGRVVGPGLRWGFCYWATDPLDNPDYERFVCDFHDLLGVFPQTTTAIAHRDVERTRALLRLSESRGMPINRFSILGLKQYRQVQAAFSPTELGAVELLPQNREGVLRKAVAGKARAGRTSRAAELQTGDEGTIACVAGFLVNMVTQSVRLIAPCRASEARPLGYIVLGEDRFTDAAELEAIAERMFSRLPQHVGDLPVVRFIDALGFTPTAHGFVLTGSHGTRRHEHPDHGPYLRDLGLAIAEGRLAADQIALRACYGHGIAERATLSALATMFDEGLFDETG